MENEQKRSENFSNKLKERAKRYEELTDVLEREKNYSNELAASVKKLLVQNKVLYEEKELLSQMNQELNLKLHSNTFESSPFKQKNFESLDVIKNLQEELAETQTNLKKKNSEVMQLELKLSESHKICRRLEKQYGNSLNQTILSEKYEVLLEKHQKIQSEKAQIQNLYVSAQAIIAEKGSRIKELMNEIFSLEERLNSSKSNEKYKNPSISNLATSRSTNKSSPKRSKTPGEA